jgi:hypothetical protein
MEWRRIVAAVVVVFLGLVIGGFLIHALWLQSTYQTMRDSGFSFRTPEALQHRLVFISFSDLLYAILFVWVYVRGREVKPWPAQGLRYGVLMTFFTIVPSSLNEYAVYNLPHMLVVKWMAAGGFVLVILGLLVALICQKSTA